MRWLSATALGLVLLTGGCLKLDLFRRTERPVVLAQGPSIGAPAPDIDGEDFEGRRFKLSDYRGKVVVVTFWASWCRYCIERMPHERAIVERYRGKPFAFLGVNNDDDRAPAMKVAASQRINWRNWHIPGAENPITDRWQVKTWPSTYVIDANGIIRYANLSGAHLDNAIESLLAEVEPKR